MRKLASIRKVSDIQPIPDADAIEVATIDGWKVVTKKGEYKPGDLCIYCEIDSLLPIREEFEFLRKSSYKKMADGSEGFRLKTIRLRQQISQGLLLPLSILNLTDVEEGMEVTELLGITKWEAPMPASLSGVAKGLFPSFLTKTDEERAQNLQGQWERFKTSGKKFYVTEKLDGSSATFYLKDDVFGVCSRNLELVDPGEFVPGTVICDDGIERPKKENSFWKVARQLDLENKFRSLGRNICLQGELIGEGIQGNPYKILVQTVRFFNGYNIDTSENLSLDDFIKLTNLFGLKTVPILNTDFQLPNTIDEVLKLAEDKSELNQDFDREGIVIRSYDRQISFKAISNKFLLNEK
jgi:RNA ligase (TIGR02306 family)